MTLPLDRKLHIHYPCSDGKPMADNTRQWNWINFIKNGLEETTANQDIFVAGDLLWYPVEGNNKLRVAPDVMAAIGRPKGDRNSYLQWKEDNLPPQIVFEVLSPGNTKKEMAKKLLWYEKYGAIEYYVYDPDFNKLEIYNRKANKLVKIDTKDWISPLLKFRLLWATDTLKIFHPNGKSFLSFGEIVAKAERAEVKAEKAEVKAEKAEVKAERAEIKAERAKAKAEKAEIKAEAIEAKNALLAAKLKELGIDPESLI